MNDAEWLESIKKGVVQNTNTPATKEVKSEPFINRFDKREDFSGICKKCRDTGKVRESNGTIHVCYDCLLAGRLDVHSKNLQDPGIKV